MNPSEGMEITIKTTNTLTEWVTQSLSQSVHK